MPEQLYKLLGPDRMPIHGGSGQWPEVGQWTEKLTGKLIPCQYGYHVCTAEQLVDWLVVDGAIYTVETRYKAVPGDGKSVVRQARLTGLVGVCTEKRLRLFAADCAEHVLPLFEQTLPDDSRPRQAIMVSRQYALGECSHSALFAAVDAAYRAYSTAYSTIVHDMVMIDAVDAAYTAASGNTSGAINAAVRAAGEAERAWQAARLFAYLTEGAD